MTKPLTFFFRRHPAAALIAINVISIFLILAFFELGLRLFTPEWLEFRMRFLNAGQHREGFFIDEDIKIVKKNDSFFSFEPGSIINITRKEFATKVKIDSLGGRSNGSNITRSTLNIVPFVGDSFIFGWGVEDNEHITALLAAELEVNVFNLGVSDTTLPQQREILHRRLDDLGHPKKVLWAIFLGNDFEEMVSYHDTGPESLSGTPPGGLVPGINRFVSYNPVLKQIYIIQFFGQKILSLFSKGRIQGQGSPKNFSTMLVTNKEYHDKIILLLDEELSAIAAEAESEQYEPFFVIIPDTHQVNDDRRKRRSEYYGFPFEQLDPQFPNKIITAALIKKNFPFIDATPCLSKNARPAELYYLEGHFTPYGYRCFSECIKDAIAEFLHAPIKVSEQ